MQRMEQIVWINIRSKIDFCVCVCVVFNSIQFETYVIILKFITLIIIRQYVFSDFFFPHFDLLFGNFIPFHWYLTHGNHHSSAQTHKTKNNNKNQLNSSNAIDDQHVYLDFCFFFQMLENRKRHSNEKKKKKIEPKKHSERKRRRIEKIYCLLNVSFFSFRLILFGKLSLSSTNRIDESILGDNNLNVCH